jgi:hypothetical protein
MEVYKFRPQLTPLKSVRLHKRSLFLNNKWLEKVDEKNIIYANFRID